jgi:PBP1b-binding outer membrane lipoprotein LpoB
MKSFKVCMSLILLAFFFAGCSCNKAFVTGVDDYANTILPDYRAYVQNDESITEDSKRIRIQTADSFRALIDEAKTNSD